MATKLDSALFGRARGAPPAPEKPFRDELLTVERLDERARSLAARFTVDPSRRSARSVFPRFDDNVRLLREAYRTLADDVHRGEFVTAAAEWMLDNDRHAAAAGRRDRRDAAARGSRDVRRGASRRRAARARHRRARAGHPDRRGAVRAGRAAHAPPAARVRRRVRLFRQSAPWAMVEVFALGVLVSMVKLAHVATVVPGVALWSFGVLMVVLAVAVNSVDPREVCARAEALR